MTRVELLPDPDCRSLLEFGDLSGSNRTTNCSSALRSRLLPVLNKYGVTMARGTPRALATAVE
jgi:hypothetical protein